MTASHPKAGAAYSEGRGLALAIGALALLLAGQFSLIFTRAINWDEFFFYGQLRQFANGDLRTPLQTIHVHAFGWLLRLDAGTIDRIVTARIPMFACELATIGCIYLLGRHFADRLTGALAALLYISAGFVLQHGMSFRVDPAVTACLMGALAVLGLAPRKWWSLLSFALLAGLSCMITIKAALYAPAFAGMAWLRLQEAGEQGGKSPEPGRVRSEAVWIGSAILASLAVFALLYAWHSAAIAPAAAPIASGAPASAATATPPAAAPQGEARRVIARSLGDMFFIGKPPYLPMMIKAASLAPFFAVLIAALPLALWRSNLPAGRRWALFGLWLPILTLAFYRNTAGYYYVFILAPCAVACVPGLAWARQRFGTLLVVVMMLITAIPVLARDDRTVLSNQRQVSDAVDAMFTSAVPYFDHSGMIPGFPKANGFMTPWGLEQYRKEGIASYRQAMEDKTVPLLIDNDYMVSAVLREPEVQILLPADAAALRGNFVQAWGPVWLAGKVIPAGEDAELEFLVPGPYRLQHGAGRIDGVAIGTGDVVSIGRGVHRVTNAGARDIRLIWAGSRPIPETAPPTGDLWIGY